MSITAAIITEHTITTNNEPIDCLLDAMLTAQNTLGQISWEPSPSRQPTAPTATRPAPPRRSL
jgi:hypothetical protein